MESATMLDLLRNVCVFSKRFCVTVLLCCLLIHQQAVSSENGSDTKEIRITYVKQDKNAILTCTAQNMGSRKIIWTKLSEPYPLAVGSTRFTPNRRYSVKTERNMSVLTIKTIQMRDAGEYECRLSGQVFAAEVISLTVKAGADSTYLIPTETTVQAQVGSTALLPCEVQNINDNVVLWKSGQDEILSLRSKMYIGDQRFKIIHNTAPQWSLEIRNLRESDFGIYTCMVNSDPVLTRSVILKNSVPPESSPTLLQDSHFKKKIVVDFGQTVTLTCNFQSSPVANVTWYRKKAGTEKPGKEKIGEGSVLTLNSVVVEQSGDYICIADNGRKPFGKGKTKLIVIGPPTPAAVIETTTFIPNEPTAPYLYYEKERTEAKVGSSARIKCIAVGSPRPQIEWKRHNQRLSDNFKYKIEEQPEARHALHSTLLIRSVIPNDFGNYSCKAWNQLGLKEMTLVLYDPSQ